MGEKTTPARRPLRTAIWGLGAMGGGIAARLQRHRYVQLMGGIDSSPQKLGAMISGVKVSGEPERVLALKPDLVIIATSSFVRDVKPQILQAVEAGANVITIAEEMSYPWETHPHDADEIDRSAKRLGVTVLGTGINPGFMLDTLIIALTSVSSSVESIHARRVNDLSPFGPTVLATQGVGTFEDEFHKGLVEGSIVGHIGFPQSIHMIGAALGWTFDRVVEKREPIVSRTHRQTPFISIEPGQVAGCNHSAEAYIGDKRVIHLEHPQQIVPSAEGVETGDYIWITGEPPVNLSIKPEVPGGIGTISMVVNMIPRVMEARLGLISMFQLRLPSFSLYCWGGMAHD